MTTRNPGGPPFRRHVALWLLAGALCAALAAPPADAVPKPAAVSPASEERARVK